QSIVDIQLIADLRVRRQIRVLLEPESFPAQASQGPTVNIPSHPAGKLVGPAHCEREVRVAENRLAILLKEIGPDCCVGRSRLRNGRPNKSREVTKSVNSLRRDRSRLDRCDLQLLEHRGGVTGECVIRLVSYLPRKVKSEHHVAWLSSFRQQPH